MNSITNQKLHTFIFFLFGFSLLILKFPPLTLLSGNSKLTSSHVLAKIILLGISIALYILNQSLYSKGPSSKKLPNLLILFYLISASISIISAQNISFFFQQYQNVILSLVIFYIAAVLVKRIPHDKIIFWLSIVGLIFLTSDALYAIFSTQILALSKGVLQAEMYSLYMFNLGENKYNLYLTCEAFLPFFIVYIPTYLKKYGGFISYSVVAIMGFLALFSNFRTRLIQFAFSFVTSIYALNRASKKNLITLGLLITVSVAISYVVIHSFTSYDIVDRFLMSDDADMQNVQYRLDTFTQATSLLSFNPITGVGLGNYKIYIDQSKTSLMTDPLSRLHAEETNDNPHSVFVQVATETGLIGLVSFVLLLLYFLRCDMRFFASKSYKIDAFSVSCIIASWTIFLYGVFNPFNSIFLNGWFWFFRGLIAGMNETNLKI